MHLKTQPFAPTGLEPDGFRGDDFDEELGLYGNKSLTRDAWHVSSFLVSTAAYMFAVSIRAHAG